MNKKIIYFIDINGNIIMEKMLTTLPLREETVVAKSIEFFNDPEPCMIHRSAVMKRLYIEINDYLTNLEQMGERTLAWKHIPSFIKAYICVPDTIDTVYIKNKVVNN